MMRNILNWIRRVLNTANRQQLVQFALQHGQRQFPWLILGSVACVLAILFMPWLSLLLLFTGAAVGVPVVAVLYVQQLPHPLKPRQPVKIPGGPRLARATIHRIPMPIAPKGFSIFVGIVDAVFIGLVASAFLNLLTRWFFPIIMSYHGFYYKVFSGSAWALAIVAGLQAYHGWKAMPVPVGSVGVPLWFGGRSPIKFLFPEGSNWSPFGAKNIDMRVRTLTQEGGGPGVEEIEIYALAIASPPKEDPPDKRRHRRDAGNFFALVKLVVAARIQTFDPFLYLSNESVETILRELLKARLRVFISTKELLKVPRLKDEMSAVIQKELDAVAARSGIDFVKLLVVGVDLPTGITDQGAEIYVQRLKRTNQRFQAETLRQATAKLKEALPQLGELELRNMVLAAAGLTSTVNVQSFEGRGATPVALTGDGTSKGGHS